MSHPHPDLAPPPPLPEDGLRVVPLGGLGEIGRNMTVFEHGDKLLIVDCGVLFPEPDQPGVDLILPDFGYIRDRLDQVEAVILTHAHEDHIGAVPYLLRERPDIPLVGSRLTLALVRSKLIEHRLDPETVEVEEGETRPFGPFTLEFLAVNHSIPDALAVAIRTTAGVVLHTGDFKMDQLPLDGRLTDMAGFARLGEQGVDLLMSDSTNAEVPGIVTPERDIAPVLDDIFDSADQRIIVACFASHVHRVQQVLDVAAAHNRKVAFVGRSMVRNMGVARDLGYLRVPGGLLVDLRDAEEMPPGSVVLISTGSQGEPMSALSRMAGRDHPIRIAAGDTVILASSLIPGNETAVYRVINGLTRLGARVVHKGSALVHVSGHAPAGELLYVLNLTRPRNFMPVHGEWRHLRAHARLGALAGVPESRIVIAEDGVVVDLVDGEASISGAVECGYVYVDGLTVGEVTESQLKDRRILGEEGFVSVVIVVDSNSGKVIGGPEVHARGSGIDEAYFGEVLPKIEEALSRAAAEGISDAYQLRQLARRVVGKWVSDNYRRRPMIIPVVVEVLSQLLRSRRDTARARRSCSASVGGISRGGPRGPGPAHTGPTGTFRSARRPGGLATGCWMHHSGSSARMLRLNRGPHGDCQRPGHCGNRGILLDPPLWKARMSTAVGIWIALVGALPVLAGLSGMRRARRLRQRGERTWAVAVSRPGSRADLQYTLTDGRAEERPAPRARTLRTGHSVLVWYDPADPAEILVHGRDGRTSDLVFVSLGAPSLRLAWQSPCSPPEVSGRVTVSLTAGEPGSLVGGKPPIKTR